MHHYPIGVPLAPPAHTSRAAIRPCRPPLRASGQPSSTHWHHNPHTPQPTLHNHQSIPPPARRTHSTTNTQSANPTTPLKPIRTGRFSPPDRKQPQPVVGSQHTESEILPDAAVQQRNGKDTPMACQRASFLNTFRRGSQRADVALAGRHRRALLRWDVPRIGGPDRRTLGGQYRANRLAGRTPSARCTPGRGRK